MSKSLAQLYMIQSQMNKEKLFYILAILGFVPTPFWPLPAEVRSLLLTLNTENLSSGTQGTTWCAKDRTWVCRVKDKQLIHRTFSLQQPFLILFLLGEIGGKHTWWCSSFTSTAGITPRITQGSLLAITMYQKQCQRWNWDRICTNQVP